MITFSKLEKKGHLGNQLFQIAATIGTAVQNNQSYAFPRWSYNDSFENALPLLKGEIFTQYHEKQFHFSPILLDATSYDVEGYFQSENYFDVDLTKHFFTFKADLVEKLKKIYQQAFAKKTILISIRRGDFVDHPDYFQLPISYYLLALISNFPDWKERSLIILSDDIAYCKFHFSFLQNAYFGDSLSAIEQLALGTLCDDFIISNSTFSWWTAWLGEKEHSKIIRPLHYFTASKNSVDSDKDYFPARWELFNHLNRKISLGANHIILGKQDFIIQQYLSTIFQFTNVNDIALGDMVSQVETVKGSVLWINNCIIPPLCIYLAVHSNQKAIGVLKGKWLNTSKYLDYSLFKRQFDYGIFSKILNHKQDKMSSHTRLFIYLPASFTENMDSTIVPNCIIKSNLEDASVQFVTFAGMMRGLPECKYYLAVKKRKAIVMIKTTVKNIIRPKKK